MAETNFKQKIVPSGETDVKSLIDDEFG